MQAEIKRIQEDLEFVKGYPDKQEFMERMRQHKEWANMKKVILVIVVLISLVPAFFLYLNLHPEDYIKRDDTLFVSSDNFKTERELSRLK